MLIKVDLQKYAINDKTIYRFETLEKAQEFILFCLCNEIPKKKAEIAENEKITRRIRIANKIINILKIEEMAGGDVKKELKNIFKLVKSKI